METELYEIPEAYRFAEEVIDPENLDPDQKAKLIKRTFILTYVWLGLHIWMILTGAMIIAAYSSRIKSNSWWSMQCPVTAWTAGTGSGYTTTETAGSSSLTVVNTVWNQSQCLKASPVKWWNITGRTLWIGYSIGVIGWIVNIIWGNMGGKVHYVYWRMTQAIAILPLLLLIFIPIAALSYGTRTDVYTSWYGGNLSISGSTYSVTTKPAGWTSDRKYLMWRDQAAIPIPANNYSLNAALAFNGYDRSYKAVFWLTLVSTLLDAALIVISFRPFSQFYRMKHAEREYQAHLVIDENGCDQYGNDHDGVPCPTPETDGYDEYCPYGIDADGNLCQDATPVPGY